MTTLRREHVDISGAKVRFEFQGKSGKEHTIEVHNPRLAGIVKRCRSIPGYELFQYVDADGARRSVTSDDVNEYLQEITGQEFTAKDFRTWGGTVIVARALCEIGEFSSPTEAKHDISEAIKLAADHLGNTPAVCRKAYVHPQVLDAFLAHALGTVDMVDVVEAGDNLDESLCLLKPEERHLLAVLARLELDDSTPATRAG